MPQISYNFTEIEPGHYFYFEGRMYQALDDSFRLLGMDEIVAGAYNVPSSSIRNYIQWLEEEQNIDSSDLDPNPLEMGPTEQHLEYYGNDYGQAVPVPENLQGITSPYNFGEIYNKAYKKEAQQLEVQHNEILGQLYKNLSTFRENVVKNFKPGGAASTAMQSFATKYEELISMLASEQSTHRLYYGEYSKKDEQYRQVSQERRQYAADLADLRATHFDIGQFSKYCESLYKTVAAPGPKIEQMGDLPKLTDYMYSQIIRSQNTEPEVP